MKASDRIRQHPWIFGLALALAVVSLADISLALSLHSARVARDQHRDRVRTMKDLANQYRALKTQSEVAGGILPSGVHLTPDAVTAIARNHGIADHISTASANVAQQNERIQEQIINLVLTGVTPEDLALFLRDVEKIAPAVETKDLRLTPSSIGPKTGPTVLVDAHVQISAYETIAQPAR